MDIPALLRVIRQWWLLIAIVTSAAAASTAFVSVYWLKPTYEAAATLVVQIRPSTEQVVYDDLLAGEKLSGTYKEILKSRLIANDVIRSLNLDMSAKQLLAKIRVESPSESIVTYVIARDGDPARAVALANAVAESFTRNVGSIVKTDNVTILDKAVSEQDIVPVSPRPVLYTSIAFLLGLMCSVTAAALLEQLDRTVRTEQQVADLTGLTVLGTIPAPQTGNTQRYQVPKGGLGLEAQSKQSPINVPV